MTWRDGVHLTGTPIWCDARRRRDVCFVSSADRVGRAGHGQLIGSPLTLALLGAREGGHLAVPLHRRFTLGTLRLELIASGRGPGAAALHVELGGRRVLYAGPVRIDVPAAVPALEPAGVRTCDAVAVAAPYGDERHRFPPLADAIAQTVAWARAQLAAGRHAVLFVDGALDGLEIAACLAAEGVPLAGDRAIRDLARRAAAHAALTPAPAAPAGAVPWPAPVGTAGAGGVPALAAPGKEPRATLWRAGDRAGAARALGDRPRATALISGRALGDRGDADAGFAWASAAGPAALLAWIEATSAREVFVTGPGAEAIVAALGARARLVGPPHQMTLFEAAAR